MESGMQSISFASSILKEKIDRNILSVSSIESGKECTKDPVALLEALTEDDIAFHWPCLSKLGFGTDQIRQIVKRLAQVNLGVEKVMQGLTYAEWELIHESMRSAKGESVTSPVSWVFKILATQGYYPRPENYISPKEQADLDAAEEIKTLTAAYETRRQTEADAWIVPELAPSTRTQAVNLKIWHSIKSLRIRPAVKIPTGHSLPLVSSM